MTVGVSNYNEIGESQFMSSRHCLVADGRLCDVSNLELSQDASIETRRKRPRSLYPSRSMVDQVDDDFNVLNEKLGYASAASYQGGDLNRVSAHSKKGQFVGGFDRLAEKAPAKRAIPAEADLDETENTSYSDFSAMDEEDRKPCAKPLNEKFERRQVEVSPGFHLPMVGAAETIHEVNQGRVLPTSCVACESALYCVVSAEFVYCSLCNTMGPVGFECSDRGEPGVLGLGLTADQLEGEMQW